LLKEWRAGLPEALERIAKRHPRFQKTPLETISRGKFLLSDAQLVLAREYGFSSWAELKERINANTAAGLLQEAIHQDDRATVVRLLRAHPSLLHIPLWSGNWGPPMSHAANLGRLEIIEAVASLGARDYQHAFESRVTSRQAGMRALAASARGEAVARDCDGRLRDPESGGTPFFGRSGSPVHRQSREQARTTGLALETYGRNPTGKHAVLEIFARQGYAFPDTPIMAFHRAM
jgi:hypothetical protein